jgi:3-oxoadipate enol-lactonase
VRTTIAGGLEVGYDLEGPAGQPVVTLIHPIGLCRQMWAELAKRLRQRFRVLAYDVRGHGESGPLPERYAVADLADDLDGLLTAIGIPETHVVGVSMGGMIAQELALRHPRVVRSLVLAATTGSTTAARAAMHERARVAEEHGMPPLVDSTLERWFTPRFLGSRDRIVARVRDMLLAVDARAHAGAWRAIAGHDALERLPAIGVPTLVMCGDADASTPLPTHRVLHDRIAGSDLTVIAGGPHMLPLERPDEFGDNVARFLTARER